MTNENSLTLFDQLTTEIILNIFDYLSSNDIIYAFFYLNQRFNSLVLHRQQFLKYIKTPTTDLYLWENIFKILGSYIQHLIITTIDFSFSLNLFPNLKSLRISSLFPIECDRLYSILKNEQFNQLTSLKIQSQIYYIEKYHQYWAEPIWRNILNKKNLQIFECLSYNLPISYLNTNSNVTVNVNIHSLSLKLVNLIDVLPLLHLTPNVKYLNLIIVSPSFHEILLENYKFPKIKLEKFCLTSSEKKRKFPLNEESFLSLIIFIKKFSLSLNYLLLNLTGYVIYQTDTFYFNGLLLQEQLLNSLIKLKTFHFYVELNKPPNNIENLLKTFENSFWLNHHWSIGMHGRYIYTLPFHFDQFDEFTHFDDILSNNLLICNSPQVWYHIRSLDLSVQCKFNSNLIKQLKIKMPNLISISLTSTSYSDIDEDEIKTTLDRVNTVHFQGEFDEDFQKLLIDALPNLKHLILTKSMNIIRIIYEKIQRLTINNREFVFQWETSVGTYFPNVKYMEINLDESKDNDAMQVLNSFRTSETLMIRFSLDRSCISFPVDTILTTMFGKVGLFETLQNYHIKYGYNCLQLIKKTKT